MESEKTDPRDNYMRIPSQWKGKKWEIDTYQIFIIKKRIMYLVSKALDLVGDIVHVICILQKPWGEERPILDKASALLFFSLSICIIE